HPPLLLLDAVARDRVASGARRRARRQIEPRVVPWTADGAALDDAFRERTSVMRAGRADRAHLAAALDDDDRLATAVAEEWLALGEERRVDAGAEIGPL